METLGKTSTKRQPKYQMVHGDAFAWLKARRARSVHAVVTVDCTPKMRHEVKGPPTLNGEVYGCGPENVQP